MTWLKHRLTAKQKASFEQAAQMGGYKTLSEFIFAAAQNQAHEIMESHLKVLANESDRKVFFEALFHPPRPNTALKKAMKKYCFRGTNL